MTETALPLKFATIGAYGFTEPAFFAALERANVKVFCDIRWRRGVRGSEYSFVNSARLQHRLEEMGINYFHFRELAPDPALRLRQAKADKRDGIAKRKRATLGEAFSEGYQTQCLGVFDSRKFIEQFVAVSGTVAFFCVEREPAACHRSLLAARLRQDLGIEFEHLLPG